MTADMDSLPEELLQLILSMVPMDSDQGARGLLALRLVCRRWAGALLGGAVWRGRRLSLWVREHGHRSPGLAALRLPLTLSSLCVTLATGSERYCKRVLNALASTPCKVYVLMLDLPVTRQSVAAVKRVLSHQDALKELHLRLKRNRQAKGDAAEILDSVASLTTLEALSIEYFDLGSSSPVGSKSALDGPVALDSALQRLGLSYGLSKRLQRCLLEGSRDSLRHVDVGWNHVLLEHLGQCPLLQSVTVLASLSARHLSCLKELKNLRTLEVRDNWGSMDTKLLSEFLDQNPSLQWTVRLKTCGRLLNASPALLDRVRYLKYASEVGQSELEWTRLLESLPNLEELHLKHITGPSLSWFDLEPFLWDKVAAAWSPRTAPALRAMHVHYNDAGLGVPALAHRLKALLPSLMFCSGPSCPNKRW